MDTITGIKVTPDGEVTAFELFADRTLHGMYQQIGCRVVDVVRVADDVDMWIDDEGLLVNEPQMNMAASVLAAAISGAEIRDRFAGTCLFLGHDDEGETQDLPLPHLQAILMYWQLYGTAYMRKIKESVND